MLQTVAVLLLYFVSAMVSASGYALQDYLTQPYPSSDDPVESIAFARQDAIERLGQKYGAVHKDRIRVYSFPCVWPDGSIGMGGELALQAITLVQQTYIYDATNNVTLEYRGGKHINTKRTHPNLTCNQTLEQE